MTKKCCFYVYISLVEICLISLMFLIPLAICYSNCKKINFYCKICVIAGISCIIFYIIANFFLICVIHFYYAHVLNNDNESPEVINESHPRNALARLRRMTEQSSAHNEQIVITNNDRRASITGLNINNDNSKKSKKKGMYRYLYQKMIIYVQYVMMI